MASGARGTGGAFFAVRIEGVDGVLRDLRNLDRDIQALVSKPLRRDARAIGDAALPLVRRLTAAAPAPQSDKMAATVRAKTDRKIVIVLGAVNPKLSGFKARSAGSKRAKGSLAWGVELGPKGGPRRHSRGGPRRRSNVYRVSRVGLTGGYVFGRHQREIGDAVAPAYMQALERAVEAAHDLQSLRRQGRY